MDPLVRFQDVAERIPTRAPYPSENDFFMQNRTVGGMATPDGFVLLNPHSNLSGFERQSVAVNELARLLMANGGPTPDFTLTPEQSSFFAGTPYEGQPQKQRETVAARIVAGDPSAQVPTPEQIAFARRLAETLMTSDLEGIR